MATFTMRFRDTGGTARKDVDADYFATVGEFVDFVKIRGLNDEYIVYRVPAKAVVDIERAPDA